MEGLVVDIIDDNRLAVFNTEVADEAGQLEARQVALGTVSGQRVQKVVAVAQPAVDTIRRPSEAARARRTHYRGVVVRIEVESGMQVTREQVQVTVLMTQRRSAARVEADGTAQAAEDGDGPAAFEAQLLRVRRLSVGVLGQLFQRFEACGESLFHQTETFRTNKRLL